MAKDIKKKFPAFLKDLTAANALASDLIQEIDSGIDAKGEIKDRWDACEAMFRNEPGATGRTVLEDFPAEHIPLIEPKITVIIDSYIEALNAGRYMVQAVPEGSEEGIREKSEALERGMNSIATRAQVLRHVRKVTQDSAVAGIGFFFVPFSDKEGFSFHSIHPNDIVITPVTYTEVDNSIMVGMRSYRTHSDIESRMRGGEYFQQPIIAAGDTTDEHESGRSATFDKTQGAVMNPQSESDTDARTSELWLCWWHKDLDGNGPKWWQLLVVRKQMLLLDIQEWPHSRPPIFDQRPWDEPVKFWPATSIAQGLQGLQIKFTEAFNLFMAGSWFAAIPPVFITSGQLNEGITSFKVGRIYQSKQGVPITATAIPCQFNGATFPAIIGMIQELAESKCGISRNGTGQALPQGSTATEASVLEGRQSSRMSAYITSFSYALEKVFGYMHEVCENHAATVQSVYGGLLPQDFYDALGAPVRWEVMGKNPSNIPQQMLASAGLLLQLSQHPESKISYPALEEMLVDASQINGSDQMYLSDEDYANKMAMQQQMEAMQAGMVNGSPGLEGVPTESGMEMDAELPQEAPL